jgi:transposase
MDWLHRFQEDRMARITRAAPHLEAEEIKRRLKLDPRPWCRQRWLIIYNALVDPREATAIAKHTGTTVAMVHQLISAYNRVGVAAVETPGKGGRRHQDVTWEEEQAFLAPFSAEPRMGKLPPQAKSSARVRAQVGHEVHKSTISRLLTRRRWRKPVPRPVHPQATAQAQEQFKQTS